MLLLKPKQHHCQSHSESPFRDCSHTRCYLLLVLLLPCFLPIWQLCRSLRYHFSPVLALHALGVIVTSFESTR